MNRSQSIPARFGYGDAAAPDVPHRSVVVVVPVLNEASSIETLFQEVDAVFSATPNWHYSMLFVDDGSTDGTWGIVSGLVHKHSQRVRGLRLRRNFGKSDALAIGFAHCSSDVVITMDGDLQDDPAEIPRLLIKIDEGYDLVSGWKQHRQDPLSKRLPSRLFNYMTSRLTGVDLRDFNCGFKAYRLDVVQSLRLQGEMHRYIPVIAAHMGFVVGEIPVNHRPRSHGVSKFGAERYVRGFLDLLTVLATTRYMKRPAHLFGGAGLLIGLVGLTALLYLTAIWMLDLGAIGTRPLLFFGILCILFSAQLITLGIISELTLRQSPPQHDRLQVKESLGSSPTNRGPRTPQSLP
jgi:glycosyltransferase involved in cell wall biosynthesis